MIDLRQGKKWMRGTTKGTKGFTGRPGES